MNSPSNCIQTIVCGDGIINLPEICDDANVIDNDGCDYNC